MLATFRNARIGLKMTVLAAVAGATSLSLAAIALMIFAYNDATASLREDLYTTARLMAENTTAALSFNDPVVANETLSTLRAKEQVILSCLWTDNDFSAQPELFASYHVREADLRCDDLEAVSGEFERDTYMGVTVDVELLDERVGLLAIFGTIDEVRERLKTQLSITLVILVGSLLATLPLVQFIQGVITEPLQQLSRVAGEVSATRNFSLRSDIDSGDEVGQLAKVFNDMLAQTESSNREIAEARDRLAAQVDETQLANEELARAMERLEETQAQLVQNEKLASLGGLVAGVAHEINTPVGVGVTAASTLEGHADDLRRKYESGELKRSELDRFIELASDSSRIILSNLRRAADLVHSFKQVAVDQSSAERREFEFGTYVDEILVSLTPKFKNTQHQIKTDIEGPIQLNSFPGALAQVLTNLVSNSQLHGFEDDGPGLIEIAARREGDQIEIEYSDDGCGMDAESVRKVFDPFYTTRRGAGGSGLGMHIVFNLVTQVLGGTINLSSTPGEGTRVYIKIPLEAAESNGS